MSYCDWNQDDKLLTKYHDTEWGIPVHDDYIQFEYISLEVMQCGLNWPMMLKKREIFRKAFDNFDFNKIANYSDLNLKRILSVEGMIKSPRKILAIINNAKCFINIIKEYGSFSTYLWSYSDNKTILYEKHNEGYIPVSNGLSNKISKDLIKRGFKYLGSVTIYSHLQACGIINDHDPSCICYKKIVNNYPTINKRRYQEKGVKRYK